MPSLRVSRASDEFAREIAGRVGRWLLLALGSAIMLVGLGFAFLPFHLGLPMLVVGLMIVLKNSFKAKRQFVRVQRAHPNVVFPIRRLMRREPEVVLVFWQQYLRVERLVLPSRYRFAVRVRRYVKLRVIRTRAV